MTWGSAPAIREWLVHCLLSPGSALAHLQKHMADSRSRSGSRFCWLLAARQARFALQDRGTDLARRVSVGENCRYGQTGRDGATAVRLYGLSLQALKTRKKNHAS